VDLLRGADRFAVVDVETTGVYNSDRVVEIGVVTLSSDGAIVDEWDTLINPLRDVGPTYLHQVTASMVSAAPTFSEVNAALAERLDGAVLVAHNLPFDSRMLVNEYERSGGTLDPGTGICTLRMSGAKLGEACRRWGIPLDNPHRALADARATARLLQAMMPEHDSITRPSTVRISDAVFQPRTLRREMSAGSEVEAGMPHLARMADRASHFGAHGNELVYMDMLDWAISDLVITDAERVQLEELGADLGLTPEDVARVHRTYLENLLSAVLRDDLIDAHEEALLFGAARELGVHTAVVTDRVRGYLAQSGSFTLVPGMRVCFTGSATSPDGSKLPRSVLEDAATDLGLIPVKSVSKKGCDLLVASDPSSQSGKAKKARGYGLPVVATDVFMTAQPGTELIAT